MNYIVLNFAYGTGPYLRTTELALAFNEELKKGGCEPLGIIVPWIYGEKQKRIMLEEFSSNASGIFLDENLGKILGSVFYKGNASGNTYGEDLTKWIENAKPASQEAKEHLSGKIQTVDLSGKPHEIDCESIVVELNRSPRIRYDIAPSYFTTFSYISEILETIKGVPEKDIAIERNLLDKGIEIANWIESKQNLRAVAYPGTFSWRKNYSARYPDEILSPPISRLYPPNNQKIAPGIFITITGIPGLERLYKEANGLGVKLYTNDVEAVANSEKALPHIIPNPQIFFQFARSGWGSVWLSMISGTPLVMPDFASTDDPEIYFNNIAVENLGVGLVYKEQGLEDIIKMIPELKKNSKKICEQILERWDTLDGNQYCAKIFAEDFLKNYAKD